RGPHRGARERARAVPESAAPVHARALALGSAPRRAAAGATSADRGPASGSHAVADGLLVPAAVRVPRGVLRHRGAPAARGAGCDARQRVLGGRARRIVKWGAPKWPPKPPRARKHLGPAGALLEAR